MFKDSRDGHGNGFVEAFFQIELGIVQEFENFRDRGPSAVFVDAYNQGLIAVPDWVRAAVPALTVDDLETYLRHFETGVIRTLAGRQRAPGE